MPSSVLCLSFCSSLLLCYFVLQIGGVEGYSHEFKEVGRFDLPQCSEGSGTLCTGSFGASYSKVKGGLVLSHQNGLSFLDDSVFPPRVGQEYTTYCESLTAAGEDGQGNILFTHDGSADCVCDSSSTKPCVPQPQILSPTVLAGFLSSLEGEASKPLASVDTDFEANAVFVLSNDSSSTGCLPLVNSQQVNGSIALVFRGSCNFDLKISYAQDAGALAVLVVNTEGSGLQIMAVTCDIPALLISYEDGIAINNSISSGVPVTIRLGSHTGNMSTPGNHSVGLLSFSLNEVFSNQGSAAGTSHTDLFKWVESAVIDTVRNHLWIAEPNGETGLIQIYDIRNGLAPVWLTNLTSSDFVAKSNIARGIFTTVGGRRYFIQPQYEEESQIVLDVTDINAITSYMNYTNDGSSQFVSTIQNGPPEIFLDAGGDLDIIDGVHVFNISNPSRSAIYKILPPSQVQFGTQVVGLSAFETRLFTSYGSDGLFLFDVSILVSPQLLAYIKTVAINGSYTDGILQVDAYNQTAVLVLNLDAPQYSLVQYSLSATTQTTSTATTTTTSSASSSHIDTTSSSSHLYTTSTLSTSSTTSSATTALSVSITITVAIFLLVIIQNL